MYHGRNLNVLLLADCCIFNIKCVRQPLQCSGCLERGSVKGSVCHKGNQTKWDRVVTDPAKCQRGKAQYLPYCSPLSKLKAPRNFFSIIS